MIRRVDEPGRPIALYLDGFQFHASADINNIGRDAAQRAGIRSADKLVWNITWDDVEAFHLAVTADPPRTIPQLRLVSGVSRQTAQRVQQQLLGGKIGIDIDALNQNPVALLLDFLARPAEEAWRRATLSAVAGLFAASPDNNKMLDKESLRDVLSAAIAGDVPNWPVAPSGPPVAVAGRFVTVGDLPITILLDTTNPNDERWTVIAALADDADSVSTMEHRARWRSR